MAAVITRSNSVTLSFTFKDENGDTAVVASATVQLVYSGRDELQTESITLTNASNVWSGTWDSSKARGGWIEFTAKGTTAGGVVYMEDGRFKTAGNKSNLQQTSLPEGQSSLRDYGDC